MACQRRAFTLVELLVVVAIIAIIVSMLLPALRSAREAGKSARCKSNQHQVGLAIGVYRMEFRGLYPPYREYQPSVESSTGVRAVHQLWGSRHYNPSIEVNWEGDPDTDQNVPDIRIGFLAPYIQASEKVLSCPSFRDWDLFPPIWGGEQALNSYALNLWMGGWDDAFGNSAGLRNESHLERGSKIINYADSIGIRLYIWWPSAAAFFGYPGPGQYMKEVRDYPAEMWLAPYNRHDGWCNYLMSDGHVENEDAAVYWWDEFWMSN
jgi:prepilin-type N-terminal cleavage/methylation domain-containing protein/prepilin-type processing-associated H-X9-DG protein